MFTEHSGSLGSIIARSRDTLESVRRTRALLQNWAVSMSVMKYTKIHLLWQIPREGGNTKENKKEDIPLTILAFIYCLKKRNFNESQKDEVNNRHINKQNEYYFDYNTLGGTQNRMSLLLKSSCKVSAQKPFQFNATLNYGA